MRGSIVKRGSAYSIVYRAPDPATGATRQTWKGGYGTKREAEAALKEIVRDIDAGTYVTPTKQTVREFMEKDWLPSLDLAVAGNAMKASAVQFYKNLAHAYVIPHLGGTLLTRLDAPTLNRLYKDLLTAGGRKGTGLSTTTVHGVHVTISRALRDAKKWGKVQRNVAADADPPKPRNQLRPPWDGDQLRAFAAAVTEDRLSALWQLAMTTGMRRGELAGLRWSDVDLDAGRLRVAATRVVVSYRVVETTPKSKSSARTIGLDAGTVAVLRSHRKRQLEERMAWGAGWTDTGLVFTKEDGSGLHPDWITRTFQRATEKAGLPVIPLHALRHSYATAGLEAGVPLKVMSERLGHSTISITADLYSHVREQVDQDAADQVAAFIFGGAG